MDTPNPLRGEVVVKLDKDYLMRPTFQCLKRIETVLGKGVQQIVADLARGNGGWTVLSIIIAEGIRAGADEDDPITRKATPDKVGDLMVEHGSMQYYLTRTLEILTHGLAGGKKPGEETAADGSNS